MQSCAYELISHVLNANNTCSVLAHTFTSDHVRVRLRV
jgi:hypothetical protein